MKNIIIAESSFNKKITRLLILFKTLLRTKPFELIMIKEGLSKLGIGVSHLSFTNEKLDPNSKLVNFPFSCQRAYFKHGLVKLDQVQKYLKQSEHDELKERKNPLKKERVAMTVGYTTVIYPPLFRLFNKHKASNFLEYNEITI